MFNYFIIYPHSAMSTMAVAVRGTPSSILYISGHISLALVMPYMV